MYFSEATDSTDDAEFYEFFIKAIGKYSFILIYNGIYCHFLNFSINALADLKISFIALTSSMSPL